MTRDGVRVQYDHGNDVRQMGANGVKLSKFSTLRPISKYRSRHFSQWEHSRLDQKRKEITKM